MQYIVKARGKLKFPIHGCHCMCNIDGVCLPYPCQWRTGLLIKKYLSRPARFNQNLCIFTVCKYTKLHKCTNSRWFWRCSSQLFKSVFYWPGYGIYLYLIDTSHVREDLLLTSKLCQSPFGQVTTATVEAFRLPFLCFPYKTAYQLEQSELYASMLRGTQRWNLVSQEAMAMWTLSL